MAAVADPTMDLIRSLDNPERFRRVEHVAIFKPHRRQFPDGTVVEVTDADLPTIAANVNRAYEQDGELVRLVIGHRKQAPNADETTQPCVVGYAKGLKAELVERPGGKVLRLTQTEYIRREYEDEAKRHPGRSPEYDPDAKTITAVALLTRDPALALGTVGYTGSGRAYQMGVEMAADSDTKTGDTDEDAKFYAAFKKYMKKYQEECAAEKKDDPKPLDYQKDAAFLAVQAEVAKVKAEQEADRKALVKERSGRMLDQVKDTVKFDYAKELGRLEGLADDKARGEHVQYMLAHYEKLPTGQSFLPVIPGAVTPPGGDDKNDPTKAPAGYDRVMQYMRSHPGVSYQAAEAAVAGK
jgi:hypothetical protein